MTFSTEVVLDPEADRYVDEAALLFCDLVAGGEGEDQAAAIVDTEFLSFEDWRRLHGEEAT